MNPSLNEADTIITTIINCNLLLLHRDLIIKSIFECLLSWDPSFLSSVSGLASV